MMIIISSRISMIRGHSDILIAVAVAVAVAVVAAAAAAAAGYLVVVDK